jgi:hypothetical protein
LDLCGHVRDAELRRAAWKHERVPVEGCVGLVGGDPQSQARGSLRFAAFHDDRLENDLHRLVCVHLLPLHTAQLMIARNWVSAAANVRLWLRRSPLLASIVLRAPDRTPPPGSGR